MILTVVTFNAYDKKNTEAFVDKRMTEIHNHLKNICKLYVPLEIMNIEITLDFKKQQQFISVEVLKAIKELDEEAENAKLKEGDK